jgi:hypothetical protein
VVKSQEPILFYQGNCDNDTARAALVSISVESALLGCGVEIYNQVVVLLEQKYECGILDCYKHPEYLNDVFKTLPGNLRYKIVDSIRKGLGEFNHLKPISQFFGKLNL